MYILLLTLFFSILYGQSVANDHTSMTCGRDAIPCVEDTNQCILKSLLCNGVHDCPSGSDERNCRADNCTSEQFYCPKGFCRQKSEKCDGWNDCEDWYDEENCPLEKCKTKEFRCLNGMCVTTFYICDGFNDCGDWSDEINCAPEDCSGLRCLNGRCIDRTYKCDGFNDCGDWSDERHCVPGPCAHGEISHRGKCYQTHISEKKITWLEAQNLCHDFNSTLASVKGPQDEKFLKKLLPAYPNGVYIGLQKDYKNAVGSFQGKFHWDDGSSLTYENWENGEPDGGDVEQCTMLNVTDGWRDIFCAEPAVSHVICMSSPFEEITEERLPPVLPAKEFNGTPRLSWLTKCHSGEMTSKFRFCDGYKDCRDGSDEDKCDKSCTDNQYLCENNACISLNFYCDSINDCGDNSDEKNCKKKACSDDEWTCGNGLCVEESKRCDMRSDCYDETDEANCEMCRGFQCFESKCIPLSWVNDGKVDCDGYAGEDETGAVSDNQSVCLYGADEHGKVSFSLPPGKRDCDSFSCPDAYFKCPFSYCMPVMFVCDDIKDCPSGEDEIHCNRYVCHGHYRCRGQSFCIHPQQLCDGFLHCPEGDDERYCPLASSCPTSCECDGRVIRCDQNFTLSTIIPSDVRKLNLSGVIIQNGSLDLSDLHFLTILDMSYCQITTVKRLLVNNTNIIYLDLSNNALQLVSEDSFSSLTELRHLDLSNNILLTIETGAFLQLSSLQYLILRNTSLGDLNDKSFTGLSSLVKLSLTNSSIEKIEGKPFISMKLLRYLDLRHNYIEQFSCCFLNHLESLQNLFTHSYQFCCDSMRPRSLTSDTCLATLNDAISSCRDLLGTKILKAILWFIVLFALLGNITVLVYRFRYKRESLHRSYGILVSSLSISDCMMGVYMLIIGCVDAEYRGTYVSEDYRWRQSPLCKLAGFLSTMSSEASCILISVITVDRFVAMKYQYGEVKFTKRSAIVAVVITWILAIVLAAIPLLPSLSHWELYSQNSVCLALPFSSEKKPGWQYSAAVFIGLNFVLFLLIGVGQILIYRELKTWKMQRSSEAKVTKHVFLVVMTDFLCWVPVGVMGIMALNGIPIDKEVFSWTAVLVLPVNSALNPLLYTLPSMLETWEQTHPQKPKRQDDLNWIEESELKETRLPSHPSVRNTRRYVGKPTDDMETLGNVMQSTELTSDVKSVLLGLIVNYIFGLKEQGRRFEAITDKNIFVSHSEEEITAVCLSLRFELSRRCQVDDVMYLSKLIFSKKRKMKKTIRMKMNAARGEPREAIATVDTDQDNQHHGYQRRGTL